MKTKIDIGSGNRQTSDDDTTTQIQIGWKPILLLAGALLIIILWIAI